MKAITFGRHGSADVLELTDQPTPRPKTNDVVVKVAFAALNHVDIWVRNGSPAYPVETPHILGADGSGIVDDVGPSVEGVSVGDRVLIFPALACGQCKFCKTGRDNQCATFEILGTKRNGTYAEHVAVPDDNVVVLPDDFPLDVAAAFPLTYLTAWHMLVSRAQLQPREKVLIVGASGGVGVAAIQIVKAMGAHPLAVTTRSEKAEELRKVGADDVLVLNESADIYKWIMGHTNGEGVDVVVEHVGPATWEKSYKCLAKYGRLVTCGATSGPTVSFDLRTLFSKDASILGARMGTKKDFQALLGFVFKGLVKPVVNRVFPLAEAADAQRLLEDQKHIGKVLLQVEGSAAPQ